MKKVLTYLCATLLIPGLTSAGIQGLQRPGGQNPEQASATPATIEGTVTRADTGQPLKGARLTLGQANPSGPGTFLPGATPAGAQSFQSLLTTIAGTIATVTTDNNGHFMLTGVGPGQYRVSAERSGFVKAEYGQRTASGHGVTIPVVAGQHLMLDLKMSPASVLSGRVITPDGEPAAQSTVQAYTYQYSNGQRELTEVKSTQTNDLGEYRLFWLEPGEYFVSVTAAELADDVPVGTVDVSQSRGGRGPNAGIQLLTAALGDRSSPLAQALGGTGQTPVYYPGTIDPGGAVPVEVPPSAEVRGVDFNLRVERTATLSGRVVAPFSFDQRPSGARGRGGLPGPNGAPQFQFNAAPVQLSLTRVGEARTGLGGLLNLRLGTTPVNADGTFELKGVAPGEYNLTATTRDPNGQEYTARTRVSVGTGDIANLVLAVRPGVEVRGRILLETPPSSQFSMTNLQVSLVAEDPALPGIVNFVGTGGGRSNVRAVLAGQVASAKVSEDGSFILENVGAMEYRVRVNGLPQGAYIQSGHVEGTDALNGPFTIDNQQALLQLELGFTPGRVSGTVADNRGIAVGGVQAVLVPDEARRGRSDVYFAATTDSNGQFMFNEVPPGRYKVFAWEDVPAGAYQYPDFIRRYEDRGRAINVPANGAISADAVLIPAD